MFIDVGQYYAWYYPLEPFKILYQNEQIILEYSMCIYACALSNSGSRIPPETATDLIFQRYFKKTNVPRQ